MKLSPLSLANCLAWKERFRVSLVSQTSCLAPSITYLFCGHSPKVSQIALVSHQHDDNVCVGMVAELFQPACDVLVGLVLGDVVDEEGADCATVVGAGDGAVTLLAGGIPDLRLDGLVVDLDAASGELDADGGLAVEVEFVAGETREKVGFTNAGVSNKDYLEEELRMVVSAVMGDHMARAARSIRDEQGAHTSYSSLAMVVVGGMGVLVVERWRGQTQRRSRWRALRCWAQVGGGAGVCSRGADNEGGMRQEEWLRSGGWE